MSLADRALGALVRRALKGRSGVAVWVDTDGRPVLLGDCGVDTLETLAWAVDQAYRGASTGGPRGGLLGDRRRLSGVRVVAHRWAGVARAHARGGRGGSGG